MGVLAGYANRQKVPITHSAVAGAGTNYLMSLEVHEGTPTIASGTWTVDSLTFHHRLTVTVNEKTGGALADWPVRVPIDTAKLVRLGLATSTGNEVRWADEAAAETKIDFWMEDVGGSKWDWYETIYWVEIPALTASEVGHEIYMYFDEELGAAATDSDGPATFSLFDHFTAYDAATWIDPQPAWATVGSSILTLTATALADRGMLSAATFSRPCILEVYSAESSTTTNDDFSVGFGVPADHSHLAKAEYGDAEYYLHCEHNTDSANNATLVSRTANTYKWFSLFWSATNVGLAINRTWEAREATALHISDEAKKVWLRAYSSTGTKYAYIDVALVRKYCAPEPEVHVPWSLWASGAGCVAMTCLDFPNDIKPTASDGTTLLRYWIDREKTAGGDCTMWIEITDDLDDADTFIYVYYGKAADTDDSDSTIFSFFQDFSADTPILQPFGYGLTVWDGGEVKDYQFLWAVTANVTGSLGWFTVHCVNASNIRIALYDSDAGDHGGVAGEPYTLLGETASKAMTAGADYWIPLAAAVAITNAHVYYIGINVSVANAVYANSAGGTGFKKAKVFAAFDSPWDIAGDAANTLAAYDVIGHIVTNPTGFTPDSATVPFGCEYDGFASDPFAEEGMWNSRAFKVSDTEYWLVTSSSWFKQHGLSLMRSSDKKHWQFVKYLQMPILSSGQVGATWDGTILEDAGVYHMLVDCSVVWPADYIAPDAMILLHFSSTNLYDWVYEGEVTITDDAAPYAPFWAKFTSGEGTFFYIYYNEFGHADGQIRSARSATVGGPYTQNPNNPLIDPGGGAGTFTEVPSVVFDGTHYIMYYYLFVDATETIYMAWATPDTEDPWEDGWTQEGAIHIDGVDSSINASFPAWLRNTQYAGTPLVEGATYNMWLTGRERAGHFSPATYDGTVGFLTHDALGGDWTTPTGTDAAKAYRSAAVTPAATLVSARTSLQITDCAIMCRVKGYGANTVAGVLWRAAIDNATYYAVYFDASTSTVYVKKTAWAAVTNAVCQFTDWSKKLTAAKQVYKDFDIRMDEHNLEVWLNGSKALTQHDASVEAEGYVKFFGYGDQGQLSSIKVRKYVYPEPAFGAPTVEHFATQYMSNF